MGPKASRCRISVEAKESWEVGGEVSGSISLAQGRRVWSPQSVCRRASGVGRVSRSNGGGCRREEMWAECSIYRASLVIYFISQNKYGGQRIKTGVLDEVAAPNPEPKLDQARNLERPNSLVRQLYSETDHPNSGTITQIQRHGPRRCTNAQRRSKTWSQSQTLLPGCFGGLVHRIHQRQWLARFTAQFPSILRTDVKHLKIHHWPRSVPEDGLESQVG